MRSLPLATAFAIASGVSPGHGIVIMLATFGLTIMTDLVFGVHVGIVPAILQVFRRMSQSVSAEQIDRGPNVSLFA